MVLKADGDGDTDACSSHGNGHWYDECNALESSIAARNVVCNLILYELRPLTMTVGWYAIKDIFVWVSVAWGCDSVRWTTATMNAYWCENGQILNAKDESNEMIPSIWSESIWLAGWLSACQPRHWDFTEQKNLFLEVVVVCNNSTLIGPKQPLCQYVYCTLFTLYTKCGVVANVRVKFMVHVIL